MSEALNADTSHPAGETLIGREHMELICFDLSSFAF
jgi:hypothetical protein